MYIICKLNRYIIINIYIYMCNVISIYYIILYIKKIY